MAIVQIGLPIDANTIRVEAGQISLELHRALQRGRRFKENCLDRIVPADLEALGFTAADVAILVNAMNDLVQLDDIARGSSALVTPKDFFLQLGLLSGVR